MLPTKTQASEIRLRIESYYKRMNDYGKDGNDRTVKSFRIRLCMLNEAFHFGFVYAKIEAFNNLVVDDHSYRHVYRNMIDELNAIEKNY